MIYQELAGTTVEIVDQQCRLAGRGNRQIAMIPYRHYVDQVAVNILVVSQYLLGILRRFNCDG